MTSTENHRQLHDLFNRRDFDGVGTRFHPEGVYVDHARGLSLRGPAEFVEWLRGWTTAMSDARVTDARYLDRDDTSVSRFVGRGVNDGPVGPLPASDNPLEFPVCEILTYDAEGKVTAGELYYDQATILVQMGVLEPPGG